MRVCFCQKKRNTAAGLSIFLFQVCKYTADLNLLGRDNKRPKLSYLRVIWKVVDKLKADKATLLFVYSYVNVILICRKYQHCYQEFA